MKVIIAGGGIAGLTLANALEKAGIDFVLLEARALLDPQVGASIAIAPSSMRIFDQFGAAQEIIDQTTPIKWGRHHRKDGSLIMPPSPSMQVLEARFGYGISFLDRQLVLRALAKSVQRQDKMLLNKRVRKFGTSSKEWLSNAKMVLRMMATLLSVAMVFTPRSDKKCGGSLLKIAQITSQRTREPVGQSCKCDRQELTHFRNDGRVHLSLRNQQSDPWLRRRLRRQYVRQSPLIPHNQRQRRSNILVLFRKAGQNARSEIPPFATPP